MKKPTLTELIETHVSEKVPVMADGTILVRGCPRPDFYILHEHVELKKRLGGRMEHVRGVKLWFQVEHSARCSAAYLRRATQR